MLKYLITFAAGFVLASICANEVSKDDYGHNFYKD
jgi:hypothetical protein